MALKMLLMFQLVGALSSQYIYGDYFYNRNYGADMVFQGSSTTDDGLVEYMRYRKANEDVNFSKDIYVNQDKRAYFHKEPVRIVI